MIQKSVDLFRSNDVLEPFGDRVYPIPLTPFPMDAPPAKCEKTHKNSYLLHNCVKSPNADRSPWSPMTPPKKKSRTVGLQFRRKQIRRVLLGFNIELDVDVPYLRELARKGPRKVRALWN